MAGISRVATLPRPVLDGVHRRLRERRPIAAIRGWLAEQGHPVTYGSMQRYRRHWIERQEQAEMTLEVAALARESGIDVRDLAGDLAAGAAIRAAALTERNLLKPPDSAEGEKADNALRRAERLARLMRSIEAATASGQERRDDDARRRALSDADSPGGLDDEALRRARMMAGLAPVAAGEDEWEDPAPEPPPEPDAPAPDSGA